MFWFQNGAVFYVNKETQAWRRNALWMFRLAKRTKEICHKIVTVQFYFKFENVIFLVLSVQKKSETTS